MIGQLTDHLLQSTLFGLAAALLVLAFRKNRARVRYSLWLAASLKFLIPFSMLIALGSQIHWTSAAHAITTRAISPDVVQTVEQFSEPFTATIPAQPQQTDRGLQAIAVLWFCGFACVAVLRLRAWRGMRIAIQRSQPLNLGLPVEARLSSGVFEPGIVGLWRPMLLLPNGILERLKPSELEAVIAHELCHIRRRDNLLAAIHMTVEALFWFHPLVWWIGARLLDERERACDEYVLSQGNQPDIYADAILNICKLYTESPLACVSGVTGADIRRRIEAIMSNQKAARLNFAQKFILTSSAIAAVAIPLFLGLLIAAGSPPAIHAQSAQPSSPKPATPLEFDAASIRSTKISGEGSRGGPADGSPLRFTQGKVMNMTPGGVTARRIIFDAYRILPYQLSGGPGWIESDGFDVEAVSASAADEDQLRFMLQTLLNQRFRLRVHHETRNMEVYALTVAKSGLKLHEIKDGDPEPAQPESFASAGAKLLGRAGTPVPITVYNQATMQSIAGRMATNRLANLDLPVVDKTGLNGHYSFAFGWDPDEDFKAAVEEALGLKFVPQKDPVDVLVIDSIERPSEN